MKEPLNAWMKVYQKIILEAGVFGMLVGAVISTWNADELGWSLLRVAGLGVVFAFGARFIGKHLIYAWVESKIQEAQKAAQEHQKAEQRLSGGASRAKT